MFFLPGNIRAELHASGRLGAAATVATVRIARVEGELSASASAGADARLEGMVELGYDNGVLSFHHAEGLTIDVELLFELGAMFRAVVLGFEWTKRWKLVESRKTYRMEAGVNLSYINGVKELNVSPKQEAFKGLMQELFALSTDLQNSAKATDPKNAPAEDPVAKTGSPEQDPQGQAPTMAAGDLLDLLHSRFALGWACRSATVKGPAPQGARPGIAYAGVIPPIGGITGGVLAFADYGRLWRRHDPTACSSECHHIASKYVFPTHPAFGPTGLSIEDPVNKERLFGHKSSHSDTYHAAVRAALNTAVAGGSPANLQPAVIIALNGLRGRICAGTLRLYDDPLKTVTCGGPC